MALLSATVLEDAVIAAQDRMTRHENRLTDTDVVGLFYQGTSNLVSGDEVKALRQSASRPVKIPVVQRLDTTVRTTRRITGSPTLSTSAFVTTSWNTVGFEVGVERAVNQDNYISAQKDLENQIYHGIRRVIESLDSTATGVLDAAKNTALVASTLPDVTIASSAYEVPQASLYSYLPTLMKKNNIQGPYSIVSNVEGLAQITQMSTQDRYNQAYLAKLYEGYNIGYSSNITAETGYAQKAYVLPNESVGMIQWTETDCRDAVIDSPLLSYYEMPISLTTPKGQDITLNFGVKYSAGPMDLSAKRAGLERAFAERWEFYVDVAFLTEYSSDTTSPIVKFNIPQPV